MQNINTLTPVSLTTHGLIWHASRLLTSRDPARAPIYTPTHQKSARAASPSGGAVLFCLAPAPSFTAEEGLFPSRRSWGKIKWAKLANQKTVLRWRQASFSLSHPLRSPPAPRPQLGRFCRHCRKAVRSERLSLPPPLCKRSFSPGRYIALRFAWQREGGRVILRREKESGRAPLRGSGSAWL